MSATPPHASGVASSSSASERRLLVVLGDPISPLVEKGEVSPRYYNPGDVFDRIHYLLLNDDHPDEASLRQMSGRAAAVVHNLPLPSRLFLRSLGWREALMGSFLREAVAIARPLGLQLVRAYGAGLNGLVANRIGRSLSLPVLVSLHNRPDHIVATGPMDGLRQRAQAGLAARVLRSAPSVIAVYRAQLPYLDRIGVAAGLAYNVIGAAGITIKNDYAVAGPLRVLSVGRQFAGKDIANLIAAVAELDAAEITVVGDGPLHDQLIDQADRLGLGKRATFVKAWENAQLCRRLAEFDVFATHNDFPGLPKAVMEPMLAGLPVVVNSIGPGQDFELEEAALLVENTSAAYRRALSCLQNDERLRRSIGTAARARALALWDPAVAEQRQAMLHRACIEGAAMSQAPVKP